MSHELSPAKVRLTDGLGPTPPLPRKKPAVFHHPMGFELYDGLAMDLHAMTYAEPLFAEIAQLRAVLAASCDDERSQMWEAGPGGGCSRAIEAESEVSRLRAALREVLEFQSAPTSPTIHDFGRWRRAADGLGA